jgi:hypothetical protein
MKRISGSRRFRFLSGAILASSLVLTPFAKNHKDHPYRYSVVDVPVSLELGTVRTPEFPVASHRYWIIIQVEKPLPFQQMECMMGVTEGLLDSKKCTSKDPLLLADWTVRKEGYIVSSGSSTTTANAKFTKEHIFKFLGSFAGEAGKKYVVEVKFTKDGSSLNVANPHLIIVKQGDE